MGKQHQTIRLSDEARALLREIAGDDSAGNLTAAIEEMIYTRQRHRVAFGQQVQLATTALIEAVRSGDEAQIGGAQVRLMELLHSLPAATGITAALRSVVADEEESECSGRLIQMSGRSGMDA